MKIELELSERNEATEAPWWVILDPWQMMLPSAEQLADMVTGPFFSRESADRELLLNRHRYGNRAVVYCMTGRWSPEYKAAIRKAREGVKA